MALQALAEAEASQLRERRTQVLLDAREAALAAREREVDALKHREVDALKALNAEQTSRGAVITLGDVLFAFLREYPERTVAIEGHTDSVGPETCNVTLSRRRAQSVQNILVRGGVDPRRISADGYGEAYPVASNSSKAGRQRNRRVDLVIQSPNSPAKARP